VEPDALGAGIVRNPAEAVSTTSSSFAEGRADRVSLPSGVSGDHGRRVHRGVLARVCGADFCVVVHCYAIHGSTPLDVATAAKKRVPAGGGGIR
jgi:hypothetical protein